MPVGVKAFIKRNVQKDMTNAYPHDLPGMSQEPSAPEPVRSDTWADFQYDEDSMSFDSDDLEFSSEEVEDPWLEFSHVEIIIDDDAITQPAAHLPLGLEGKYTANSERTHFGYPVFEHDSKKFCICRAENEKLFFLQETVGQAELPYVLIHADTYELWYWHVREDVFEQVREGDGLSLDFYFNAEREDDGTDFLKVIENHFKKNALPEASGVMNTVWPEHLGMETQEMEKWITNNYLGGESMEDDDEAPPPDLTDIAKGEEDCLLDSPAPLKTDPEPSLDTKFEHITTQDSGRKWDKEFAGMNDELEAMNEMMQSTSSGANNFSSGGSNDFVNKVTDKSGRESGVAVNIIVGKATPRGAKTTTPRAKNKISDANILLMSKKERMKYFEEQEDDDDDDEGLPQMPGFGGPGKVPQSFTLGMTKSPPPNAPLPGKLSSQIYGSRAPKFHTEQKAKSMYVGRQKFTPTSNHVKETTSVSRRKRGKQKFVNQYWVISELGRGSYGEVKLCADLFQEGRKVAMKVMNHGQLNKRVFAKNRKNGGNNLMNPEWANVKKELEIMKLMRSMNHRNVVKLYEIIDDPADDRIYLVMEYCNGGDLKKLCDEGSPNPFEFRNIFTQVLAGLEYLHINMRVAHCDLKPENILIQTVYADGEDRRVVKIADFGVSRHFQNDERSFLERSDGTIAYTSPEAIDASTKDFHAWPLDIWSAAVCGLELLTGQCPFASQDDYYQDVKEKIMTSEPDYPEIAPNLIDLFKGMLKKDPKERLSIEDIKLTDWVLEDEWPNDIEDDGIEYAADRDVLEIQETDFMKKATHTFQMITNVNSRVKRLNILNRAGKRRKKKEQYRNQMYEQRSRAKTIGAQEHNQSALGPKPATVPGHLRSHTDGDLGGGMDTPKDFKEKTQIRRFTKKRTGDGFGKDHR